MSAVRLVLAALMFGAPVLAQDSATTPIEIGFERTIHSEVLDEDRRLWIALPDGYEASEDRYPVIYLCDGDAHFAHTSSLLRFEAEFGRLPPAILVAIPNTDRTRDLTPETSADAEQFPNAGGVDEFLRFLRAEVFPLVERDYRGSSHRTLIGHSFGGLAVLHCLVHSPADFSCYLAISPSLWWDEQRLIAQATEMFPEAERRDVRMFMTLGSEGGRMSSGYLRMEALLSERSPDGLVWDSRRMIDESHQTIPYRSTLHGLLFLFRPFAMPEIGRRVAEGGWSSLDQEAADLAAKYGPKPPIDFRIVFRISEELSAERRFDDLVRLYESAPAGLEIPPIAWEFLGEQALAGGEREIAVRAYTQALRSDPASEALRETLRSIGGDPDAIPVPPPFDPARAEAIAGRYQEEVEGSEMSLVVEVVDGALIGTLPDGARAPLEHAEGDRFRMFQGFVVVTFRFAEGADTPTDLVFAVQGEPDRVLAREGENEGDRDR